jgi:hypothetical protein
MSEPFDPFRKWLGIPPKDQPPNHYRLLGIATFENDPDVIENAATRQMAHVRTFKNSKHASLSQRILTELSAAKLCLLSPEQKPAYDAQLRGQLAAAGRLSDSMVLGATPALNLPPVVEVPPLPGPPLPARREEDRWRMDEESQTPSLGPPPVPVPIPMPVGTAVAPVPVIRRSSAAALRARRERSAVPMAVLLISLVAVGGVAGVAALVFGGVLGGVTNRPKGKSTEKPPALRVEQGVDRPSAKSTPASSNSSAAAESSATEPVETRKSKSTAFPVGSTSNKPLPPASAPPPQVAATEAPAIDRVRQALFQAQEALAARDDDRFVRQITLAEKDLASGGIVEGEREKLQQQTQHLRGIQRLARQFWETVRDNLHNHLPVGEKVNFFQNELTISSRQADVVELTLNGETQKSTIPELDPRAAALVAARTAKITEPATLFPIMAFLSIDGRAQRDYPNDHVVKFARKFFSENQLAGEQNLEIIDKLGVKLATEMPAGDADSPDNDAPQQ